MDLRVARGLDLRVLPDRGLDLGAAWFGGVPLAWSSAVGESCPLPTLDDVSWLQGFGGGLITTCGLRNVGAPSEGHGLHGAVSHQRSRDVRSERRMLDDGQVELAVSGTVDETEGLTGHLRLERRVATRTGSGSAQLTDTVTNLSGIPEPSPLLYHVNLGVPLWNAGALLDITANDVIPCNEEARSALTSWAHPPEPDSTAAERVFEHRLTPDAGGWASATVTNAAVGLRLRVSWDAATLPRCMQWVHPALGVLGVEPANCSVFGRAADRAAGALPVLEPQEKRTTQLRITVEPLS